MSDINRLLEVEHGLSDVKTTVASMQSDITYIKRHVENAEVKSQTNWGTLAGWASVILAIVLYHSNLINEPLSTKIQSHDEQFQELLEKDIANNKHWQGVERFYSENNASLRERIAALEALETRRQP